MKAERLDEPRLVFPDGKTMSLNEYFKTEHFKKQLDKILSKQINDFLDNTKEKELIELIKEGRVSKVV